ncbi:MAG: ABC transporter permease [Gemmatimonadales bacterium]|nr:ABC transporter permease [Gemmatimonadales bacterium]
MSSTLSRAAEGVGIALDSLRASKVRAALTILGVAIGVMVVIAMASAITGINRSVEGILESAGPRTFFIYRWFEAGLNVSDGSEESQPWRRNPNLTAAEAEMIRQLPLVQDVNISERAEGPVQAGDVKLGGISMEGVTPSWVLVTGGDIVAGRNFTPAEYVGGARVTVINDKLAERLFPGLDPIGKTIKMYGMPFTVIGLHVEASSLFGNADSPKAVMPHTVFTKVATLWRSWLDIHVLPKEGIRVVDAMDQVTAALRASRGLRPAQDNNFSIVTQDKLLESFDQMTQGFFLVMLALSSVGLMVGGIGVIAIMMISVTERTREIGVRKALGATRREIMFQFLVEAATLTLVGGAVGMVLGAGVAQAIKAFSPIPASIPLWSVIAALSASVITGVFFGLYPASKASRLDPVEALRYE